MDFNFFFRRFGHNDGQNIDPFTESEDIHEDEHRSNSLDPFGSPEHEIHDIFHHMEDMFNKVFSTFFGPMESLPSFEEITSEKNPRDIMLKEPDSNEHYVPPPCIGSFEEQESETAGDIDIDDKVAKEGLFPLKQYEDNPQPRTFSYKKFSSVRTIRLPDGTTEEHRSFTDSTGKKVTKIRRCIGDQCHEVVSQTDGKDTEEKEEKYINIDEAELSDFEKKWRDIKSGKEETSIVPASEPTLLSPPGDPSYYTFFRKFFFK